MSTHFPIKFTLENGTHVIVHQKGDNTYDFTLNPEEKGERHFTYVSDDRPKTEVEESLNFDEVDALRKFWLETEDIL